MAANAEQEYLTVDEVAARLRLGRATVWRRIKDGTFPVVRIGRTTRLRWSDIEEVLEAHLEVRGELVRPPQSGNGSTSS